MPGSDYSQVGGVGGRSNWPCQMMRAGSKEGLRPRKDRSRISRVHGVQAETAALLPRRQEHVVRGLQKVLVVSLSLALTSVTTAGCALSDDAARAARGADSVSPQGAGIVDDVSPPGGSGADDLTLPGGSGADDLSLPGGSTGGQLGTDGRFVTEQDVDASLQEATEGVPDSVAAEIVAGGCLANTLVEIGKADSWSEAAQIATREFGGSATFQFRVEALGKELSEAQSRGDQAAKIAVATTCEAFG